ncbi:unannotated protein [freshwater metagenome]|uniref:Unannotated protein n=1 Tax=freshwater metagenome TaxID=449393 RepID=A0A6J7EU53_9ZZZZ
MLFFNGDPSDLFAVDLPGLFRSASWHAEAACVGEPTATFINALPETTRHALSICAGCTVRVECLQAGIDGNEVGVWGGTTGPQRRRMKARATMTRRDDRYDVSLAQLVGRKG